MTEARIKETAVGLFRKLKKRKKKEKKRKEKEKKKSVQKKK